MTLTLCCTPAHFKTQRYVYKAGNKRQYDDVMALLFSVTYNSTNKILRQVMKKYSVIAKTII